ncbi:MAG: FHA domain-containing protein [Lentisphaerae bacterium]|nr:FHA domain-containing protein [Lentisphaerota bacterium]
MEGNAHLVVEKGADTGRRITIPPQGARLGRSTKSDIVIPDPAMSRHHCRMFFKPGLGLAVADLGSANATLVNGAPVQEKTLRPGDTLLVGDTLLRVLSAAPDGAAPAPDAPAVHLFPEPAAARPRRSTVPILVAIAAIVAALAVTAWLPRLLNRGAAPVQPLPAEAAPADTTVEIAYEKIEATAGNIFRYALQITADGRIAVQIDDVVHDRHVRKEEPIDAAYARNLAQAIVEAGFFNLDDRYVGIQPDVYDAHDLSVTVGRRTHRARVENRAEPDAFREAREKVEEAGKIELGLWAIQYSPEKLTQMARESYLLAKKLYDEREIKYGNLFEAMRKFQDTEWLCETVEPKPEFYADALSGITTCRQELQEAYESHNFRAERAIRLREWEGAATELRIICEMIPDRADPRHVEARKKLLDVSNRIGKKR